MQVEVNGEPTELPDGCTVRALLERQGVVVTAVAVAVNAEVVPRTQFGERPLRAGDRVEIIRAVGGG